MKIGVFDSGLGGLTVLKQLVSKYPNCEYIYVGDNKNVPYGSKSKEELFNLSSKIIDFLLSKKVDIIIIACGTISSNIYFDLKQKYDIPIYDIISPTINYLNDSGYNKIGVMATVKTIESNIFNNIHKEVVTSSCPLLVPYIEGNTNGNIDEIVEEYLKNMNDIDALVLGCTHYPILENIIKKHTNATLINMGKVLCDYISIKQDTQKIDLYFSHLDEKIINNINKIIDFDYELKEL